MRLAVNAVAVANATTFALSCVLGALVLARGPAGALHRYLLLLVGGILIWSGGAVWRAMPVDHEQMMAAHHLVFLGVNAVPVIWLMLSLNVARPQFFEAHPRRKLWLVLPGVLLYIAFVTNPAHGAFAHIQFERFERGPLFWGMIAWAFACSVSSTLVLLQRARSLAAQDERWSAANLLAVALIPQVVAATYLFHIVPWPIDPTPASLGISAALLYPILLRRRTFEDLPLLRRDVIEHLADAVVIADPDGRIVDLNPAAETLVAVEQLPREIPLADLLAEIAPEQGADVARAVFEHGSVACPDLKASDGRRFRLQAARVTGVAGASAGYFVVLHDRSPELRAERGLRVAQKLESVGLLAAGIAHEVNNPLAFVRSNLGHLSEGAELAKRLAGGDVAEAAVLAEMPEVLAETRQGIERIAEIVSGIRGLSRDIDPGRRPLDLTEVANEAIRMAVLGRFQCPVERRFDPALPAVSGSQGELIQVLLNLLLNAAQAVAHQKERKVRVSTSATSDTVTVTVEDNGPGIPDALLDRIFDPFFTTKGPDQGSGLGLSIAFDLVRDHGGQLEVDASPLGGARFALRLPVPHGPYDISPASSALDAISSSARKS